MSECPPHKHNTEISEIEFTSHSTVTLGMKKKTQSFWMKKKNQNYYRIFVLSLLYKYLLSKKKKYLQVLTIFIDLLLLCFVLFLN